jgi:transcriptional/translational regulatory protein YebC/TACO1
MISPSLAVQTATPSWKITLKRFELDIHDSKIAHIPSQPVALKETEQAQVKELVEALENHSDVLEVFSDSF